MTEPDPEPLGVAPRKPNRVSRQAEKCLLAIAARGYGGRLSLGGASALAYYHEYRDTHDVDAWWEASTTLAERNEVVDCVVEALRPAGDVQIRAWGDVVSVELTRGGKKEFSFQIANRDARLETSVEAPWPQGLRIDSFADLVAAKMVALVERGAPRDFRDLYALCHARLLDPRTTWRLWRRRQELAERDPSPDRARLGIETHLARIEAHRPIGGIADPEERDRARKLRQWFRQEFLDAAVD